MDDSTSCNSVLAVSCGSCIPLDDLLDNICQEALYNADENIECQQSCDPSRRFTISNKYYTASICLKSKVTLPTRSFDDTFEAAIVAFDSSQDGSLQTVIAWFDFLSKLKEAPAISLLLDYCPQSDDSESERRKTAVLKWCVENEVELIDVIDIEDQSEAESYDVTGYKRVYQALSAHMWPNMSRCGEQTSNGISHGRDHTDYITNVKRHDNSEDSSDAGSDLSIPYMQLSTDENNLSHDDIDEKTFDSLFENMKEMKENATTMPNEERKAYAEKVVLAFWKAMEGDDDEIEGLE